VKWLLALAFAFGVPGPASLHAQRATSIVGFAAPSRYIAPRSITKLVDANSAPDPGSNTRAIRLLTATGGALVGIVAGGTAGYQLIPHHDCGCDDPGLDELIWGAVVGSSIGAALGAAVPHLGSVCSFNERIKRTLIGGVAGGALGFAAGIFSGSEAILFTVPAFSVGEALGSLGRCWNAVPA